MRENIEAPMLSRLNLAASWRAVHVKTSPPDSPRSTVTPLILAKIWFVESLIQISPLTNAEGFPAIGKTARPAFVTSCANEFLFPAMKVFAVLRYAIFAVSESAAVERRVPPPAAA